ncbi:MAG: TonB-dependent receptor [Daejeonella sp.]
MKNYLLTFLLLACFSSVAAQNIQGRILDSATGRSLTGATIILEGGISRNAFSDGKGEFRFKQVPSGSYRLKISLIGFKPYIEELELRQDTVFLEVSLENSVNELPEVQVISASRRESSELTLPHALSVLNQPAHSDNIPRSTPEALNVIPGVFVQKTNHGGGSPFIRGLTGNQTLIMIDGIRMNNSTFRYGPNQYLNTIDLFSIRQIEVLRGSGSVQYGSDALGGVIQVFTKEQAFSEQRRFNGTLTGRYGSGGMEKTGSGEFGFSSSKVALSAVVSLKDFGDLIGGDTTGRQTPSGYTEADAHFKAKWKLSESAEITFANQFVQQNSVDVFHKVALENYNINEMGLQTRNLSYLKMKIKSSRPLFEQVNIIASLNATREERNSQRNASVNLSRETDRVGTSNLSAELFSTLSKSWTANSGAEFYQDRIRSKRGNTNTMDGSVEDLRGLYPDNSVYTNTSAYTLHHIRFGNFNVEAGARYNWLNASLKDKDLGSIRVSPHAFVLNAGVNYTLHAHHFYTSFNSGYRAPNIDDMGTLGIVDFRYELPAYSLKPEKSYNTELGYKYAGQNWNAGLAFYYNRLNDLITRIPTGQELAGYKVYTKENTEIAIIKGLEGYFGWKINSRLALNSFASFNHGQNLTRSEPLRRVPPLNGHVSVKYNLNRFYLKGEMAWADTQDRLAAGDKDDNRIPLGGTPGWKAFNMYSGYYIKSIHLGLSAQNLLNSDYRTHGSGINSVGRSLLISMNYNF